MQVHETDEQGIKFSKTNPDKIFGYARTHCVDLDEDELYKHFKYHGYVVIAYMGGDIDEHVLETEKYTQLGFGYEIFSEDQIQLYHGYVSPNGSIAQDINIPDEHIRAMFPNDEMDVNCAEGMSCIENYDPTKEIPTNLEKRIVTTLSNAGFVLAWGGQNDL